MLRRVLLASQALAAAANVAVAEPPRTCVAPECPFPSSILRESQRHLESAVNYSTSMDVVELARSIETLMPVVDVLASFVAKPLRKDSGNLQRAATSRDIVDLEALVAREREPGDGRHCWSLLAINQICVIDFQSLQRRISRWLLLDRLLDGHFEEAFARLCQN